MFFFADLICSLNLSRSDSDLRTVSQTNYKELIENAKVLEGMTRHASIHAAGVVVAPGDLTDFVPLYRSSQGDVTTQYDMKELESIGLLKMDFLGLRNLTVIGWTTIIFGILLYIGDRFHLEKNIDKDFNYKSAIIIGFCQILSLVPGVSRSGITITAARILNFKRYDSAKISFLLSIPTLGAVSLFGLHNLIQEESLSFTFLSLLSIFFSFIFSFITIKYFLIFIKKFNLSVFVIYRILLGILLLSIAYL